MNDEKAKDALTDEIPNDPPPPYEDFQDPSGPLDSSPLPSSSKSKPYPFQSARMTAWPHQNPLLLLPPDPTRVPCRCRKHNDTTKADPNLPAGHVRCRCGYTVTSSGSAFYRERQTNQTRGMRLFRRQRDPPASKGKQPAKSSRTSAERPYCAKHNLPANHDAQKVACSGCRRTVDTTATWTIRHGRQAKPKRDKHDHPLNGYTEFDYVLPAGKGRCECGMTVCSDGTAEMEHSNACCKVLSKREEGGKPERYTCSCI